MRDVRKVDLEHMRLMIQYLTSEYPQYFRIDEYEHPIWGVRTSLIIIADNEKALDIQVINEITINYELNYILIKSDLGNFMIADFIKDKTVI